MICKKCGRKFDDDMPKCLWCDAPNPKYSAEDAPEPPKESKQDSKKESKITRKPEKEAKRHAEAPAKTPHKKSGRESGTSIFWLAFFGGFFGAHCFKAHRYRRGILYLLFGGAIYRLLFKAYMHMGIVFPMPLAAFFLVASLVVGILYVFDIWKIALEKYRNHKTHHRYLAMPWMKIMACVAVAIYGFIAYSTVNFIKDNIVKHGRPTAAVIALKMEAYTIAQEKYFSETGKIGNFKEINYNVDFERWMRFYSLAEEDKSLRVTYMGNLNCPKGTTWTLKASVVDSSLVWDLASPTDARCTAMAPQLAKLEKRVEEKELAPAGTPELNKGVDGVGVVPDSAQHRDSL